MRYFTIGEIILWSAWFAYFLFVIRPRRRRRIRGKKLHHRVHQGSRPNARPQVHIANQAEARQMFEVCLLEALWSLEDTRRRPR